MALVSSNHGKKLLLAGPKGEVQSKVSNLSNLGLTLPGLRNHV